MFSLWPPRLVCQYTERLPTLPPCLCLDAQLCVPLLAAACRYPEGESYLDLVARLWPVVHQLEQRTSPVVVVAHQVGKGRCCSILNTASCHAHQHTGISIASACRSFTVHCATVLSRHGLGLQSGHLHSCAPFVLTLSCCLAHPAFLSHCCPCCRLCCVWLLVCCCASPSKTYPPWPYPCTQSCNSHQPQQQ
jgi:hypothetical protein